MDISSGDKYLESISSKYGSLDGDLIVIDLSRNQLNSTGGANIVNANFGARNTNLGLSLAGNKDRSSYKIFVCGIHPQGLCARDGRIQIGDQLIEANGVSLLNRSHLNAGAILQQLPGFHIKLVVLRKNDALQEMAVRPITQFPADDDLIFKNLRTSLLNQSLSNEIMEKFKNMIKIVTLKKDTKGLGLMIIEGNHPDIGKGIFISEIHPGSVAEDSDLQVGDMLISVNQIQLINTDYDLALKLLKNMDGLINIVAIKAMKDQSNESFIPNKIIDFITLTMNQLLNCFPLGPTTRIIKSMKLMKRKSHQQTANSKSNKSELSVFDDCGLKRKFNGESINEHDSKQVKLVNYSDLNASIIPETTVFNENVSNESETIKPSTSKSSSSIFLAQVAEERMKVIEAMIENRRSEQESDEEMTNRILHELHVNSSTYSPPVSTSSSNEFCTLAKHVDSNVEDVTNQIDCFPNEITKHIESTTVTDTKLSQITVHSNESLITKLIDTQLNAIDEVDSVANNATINSSANDKYLLTEPPITNKEITTQQINESTISFEESKRKTNKKLIQDTDLRTNAILNGVETWIELNKGNNCALGIDLIDRMINDRKLFIIHEIIENGIAETDHRLKIGDVILQINDIPLKEMSCEEAVEHLNCTSGSVKLLVYREFICINDRSSNESLNNSKSLKVNYSTESTMQENERDENVEQRVINGQLYEIIKVELQKKINKGLGICIVNDDRSPGPYISEILQNSTAYLEGHLKKGDHIVNVNGEDVSNRPINTILTMLKCLQGLITLKVARLMPGQVITDESKFKRSQQQSVEPIKKNFKVLVLNLKQSNVINVKRKLMKDRVKELIVDAPKDMDSLASFSLINETVIDELNSSSAFEGEENSSISKNWVKIEKTKRDEDQNLNENLAFYDCPTIDQLVNENRIIEIDGQHLNDSNEETLIKRLKRSTSIVQMVVVN